MSAKLLGATLGLWTRHPTGIFQKPEYTRLSAGGKALLSWLVAGPQSGVGNGCAKVLGLCEATPEEIARRMGSTTVEIMSNLEELHYGGWIVWDGDTAYIAIPAAIAQKPCQNPDNYASWVRAVAGLPESSGAVRSYVQAVANETLRTAPEWREDKHADFNRCQTSLSQMFPGLSLPPLDTVSPTVAPTLSTQEQEQEHLQLERLGQGQDLASAPASRRGSRPVLVQPPQARFLALCRERAEEFTQPAVVWDVLAQDHICTFSPDRHGEPILHLDLARDLFKGQILANEHLLREIAKDAGYSDGFQLHICPDLGRRSRPRASF